MYKRQTQDGPKHLDMNLTRAKFDELTHDLIEKTAIPVQNALKDAGITASELGKVLLVGGSTRMLAAQEKVKQITGHEPSKSLNPDAVSYTHLDVYKRQGKHHGWSYLPASLQQKIPSWDQR